MTHRYSRRVLAGAALAIGVGCGGSTTGPNNTLRVGSIAISGPTEITGPGVVRASVAIMDLAGVGIGDDSVATTITTFSGDPSAVSVPEPLANVSVGGHVGVRGCGVSTSHVGYCWNYTYVGSPVGQ